MERFKRVYDAQSWSLGTPLEAVLPLLPRIPDEAVPDVWRLVRQCSSIGPRIIAAHQVGSIGGITWGGDDARVDATLSTIDLHSLCTHILRDYLVAGVASIVVRQLTDDSYVLEPLLGYVDPIYEPGTRQIIGCREVYHDGETRTHIIREYEGGVLYEWRSPDPFSTRPRNDGTPTIMPHLAVSDYDDEGRPIGMMMRVLPLVQADFVSQLRAARAEENTAFPRLIIRGTAEGVKDHAVDRVLVLQPDGDARYLQPGDLSVLQQQHDRILTRLNQDAMLPSGLLTRQAVSGEALRESNQLYIAACARHARMLSDLLTLGVRDLLTLLGLPTIDVTVSPNREFSRQQEVDNILNLYRAGVIPLEAAARAVSPYVPGWGDAEVESWLATQAAPSLTFDSIEAQEV